MKFSLTILLIAAVLSGCSPKVYTSIRTSHPARTAGSPVLVYEPADSLPDTYEMEVLGTIKIKDTGFSVGCNYPTVIQKAKDEVNKIGGNGLYISTHRLPGLKSSCHQIEGYMIWLPEEIFLSTYFDNMSRQKGYELLYGGVALPQQPAAEDSAKRRSSRIVLGAGYGFLTSKYYYPTPSSGNPKSGLDINAAYQWTGRGLGFGLRYSGYFSSFTYGGEKNKIGLDYFAPELVFLMETKGNWAFCESLGIGYVNYRETNYKNVGGFGFHLALGAEYKFSPGVGLGIEAGYYGARFSDSHKTDGDSAAGINRVSLNGGLRFYF